MEPISVGMTRWCDMFTPRQLLGHLILIEELNRLKPRDYCASMEKNEDAPLLPTCSLLLIRVLITTVSRHDGITLGDID